jgi:tetratricopeptide (TPR) repeat protein
MTWIIGLGVGAVSAFVIGWFGGFFGELLPSPKAAAWALREWSLDLFYWLAPGAPSTEFIILISILDRDAADLTHTHAVGIAFRGQPGVQVREIRKILRPRTLNRNGEIAASQRGRIWLKRRKADLLIWGDVVDPGSAVSLGFTADNDEITFRDEAPFYLEGNVLEGRFTDVAAAQLTAMALSAINPIDDLAQTHLANTLTPAVTRLENLVVEYPNLTNKQRRDLTIAKGQALGALADESGDPDVRGKAISIFEASLPEIDRENEPALWAKTFANLGSALNRRGEATLSVDDVEHAIMALKTALQERTESSTPLVWASTQNNLGNALCLRAKLKRDPNLFPEGLAAYEAALRVRTREQFPVYWAFVTNNLANAISELGKIEEQPGRIERAIPLYREALGVAEQRSAIRLQPNLPNNLPVELMDIDLRDPPAN